MLRGSRDQLFVASGRANLAAMASYGLAASGMSTAIYLHAGYPLWRDFPYEYERDRLAIDLINGSELLRRWVDDAAATAADLDAVALPDEASWLQEREAFLLYR